MVIDLAAERTSREARIKAKQERIRVDAGSPVAPTASADQTKDAPHDEHHDHDHDHPHTHGSEKGEK